MDERSIERFDVIRHPDGAKYQIFVEHILPFERAHDEVAGTALVIWVEHLVDGDADRYVGYKLHSERELDRSRDDSAWLGTCGVGDLVNAKVGIVLIRKDYLNLHK